MMAAVSLLTGICTLREEHQFLDYTIEVGDKQFQVHKLVLVSVSDYFKVMLTGGMKESQTDRVRLEGLSSRVVADMINFIYTGRFSLDKVTKEELLTCAIYLQIPAAIKECTRLLLTEINESNWYWFLSTFKTYGCKDGIDQTLGYVRSHLADIVKIYVPHNISYDELLVLAGEWQTSEWELLSSVEQWVYLDYENRVRYLNEIMSRVRFGLFTSEQLQDIKDKDVYSDSDGSWRELVAEAEEYHKLAIHQKVLDDSEQSRVRADPVPFYHIQRDHSPSLYYSLQGRRSWKKDKACLEPTGTFKKEHSSTCVVVNNFLILCYSPSRKFSETKWYLFDPRTLQWSPMAQFRVPRGGFGLVQHDKRVYALGGCTTSEFELRQDDEGYYYVHEVTTLTDVIESYDFIDDSWSVLPIRLPVPVAYHGACVIGNCIYILGGTADAPRQCALDCLNLSTNTWHSKAPSVKALHRCQSTNVLQLGAEQVLFVVEYRYTGHFYSPSADQWSVWECLPDLDTDIFHRGRSSIYVDRNTLYLLNFAEVSEFQKSIYCIDDLEFDDCTESRDACVKWTFEKLGQRIKEVRLDDFPCELTSKQWINCTALLSVPPQSRLEADS